MANNSQNAVRFDVFAAGGEGSTEGGMPHADKDTASDVRFDSSVTTTAAAARPETFATAQDDRFAGRDTASNVRLEDGAGTTAAAAQREAFSAAQDGRFAGRDTASNVRLENEADPNLNQGLILDPISPRSRIRAAGVPRFPGKIAGVPVADEW